MKGMKNELRSLTKREVLNTLDIKGRSGYECWQVQLTTISSFYMGLLVQRQYGRLWLCKARIIPVASHQQYIEVQLIRLESSAETREVLGSSPRASTKRIPFTASKWSRDRKSHHKGASSLTYLLYAAVAQRQSTCLLSKGSRYRNSLAAPIAAGNRKFVGENVNPHRSSEAVAEMSGSRSTLKCPQLWSCNYVILVLTTHNQKKCSTEQTQSGV